MSQEMTVIGASGFVGANLVRFFAERDILVNAVSGPTGTSWRRADHPNVRHHQVNLCDEKETHQLVTKLQPQFVVNCAAFGAYSFQKDYAKIFRVNIEGISHLFKSLLGVDRLEAFVQLGSSSEYGWNCEAPEETDLPQPDSHYAVSKVAATHLTQFYARKHDMPAWSFRLYSAYGPFEEVSRLVPTLLEKAQAKTLPPLVNPKVSRDFLYVDDLGEAILSLLDKRSTLSRGEVFNIGSGTCTTLENLVSVVRQLFDIPTEPEWGSMENRAWDHADWCGNVAKAQQVLGWYAQTDLSVGLTKTFAWLAANKEIQRLGHVQSAMPKVI